MTVSRDLQEIRNNPHQYLASLGIEALVRQAHERIDTMMHQLVDHHEPDQADPFWRETWRPQR